MHAPRSCQESVASTFASALLAPEARYIFCANKRRISGSAPSKAVQLTVWLFAALLRAFFGLLPSCQTPHPHNRSCCWHFAAEIQVCLEDSLRKDDSYFGAPRRRATRPHVGQQAARTIAMSAFCEVEHAWCSPGKSWSSRRCCLCISLGAVVRV